MKLNKVLALSVLALFMQANIANASNLYLNSIIGKGEYGNVIGSLTQSTFRNPYGIAFDKLNNLYIVDTKNNMLKEVVKTSVTKVLGKTSIYDTKGLPLGGFKDGLLKDAEVNQPRNIALNSKGEFVLTDSGNNIIRLVTPTKITTIAGDGKTGYLDGKNKTSRFNNPTGVAIDKDGNIYVADTGNNVIRKISTKYEVTTFAGINTKIGQFKDGDAKDALFNEPTDLYMDGTALYVADSGNQAIRKIENGKVTTVAGSPVYDSVDYTYAISGDVSSIAKSSKFNFPKSITMLKDKTLIIADTWNKKIKYINKAGFVEEFKLLIKNKDKTVSNMFINGPVDIVENAGKLYVSDVWDNCIYVFDIEMTADSIKTMPQIEKIKFVDSGKLVPFIEPISNGVRVMVPFRKFFESKNSMIGWNAATKEAMVIYNGKEYRFPTTDPRVSVVDSVLMIDVDYLKEKCALNISYDETTNTVTVK